MQTLAMLLLVLSLGSPVYAEREKAHLLLAAHLAEAEPLLRTGVALGEPEVQARCGALLDQWAAALAPTMRPAGYPWAPWIDSLPAGYPERAAVIADYLYEVDARWQGEVVGTPEWSRYRQATVYWLLDRLRAGVPVVELQATLDAMAAYEKRWVWERKDHFTFSPAQLQAAGAK